MNGKIKWDAFLKTEKRLLVMKPEPVSSITGKRKISDQVIVKESGLGSSFSRKTRLEFLKNQEVLGGRVFDPAMTNTPKMSEFLEMVKF